MKLDASAAWDDAKKMLSANREVVLILAGVFFFLPYLAFSLFLPDPMSEQASASGDVDAVMAAMTAFYSEFWWALLLLIVTQAIGVIAVLAVLGDTERPTVGDAMNRGLRFLPTQFAAQILSGLAAMLPVFVAIAIGTAAGSNATVALLIVLATPVVVYLVVKFSISSAAIAIESVTNPIAALQRSWRLTKGNSFRLFFFYLLLVLAFVVVSFVISLVLSLLFALGGEQFALVGGAVTGSVVNAIFAVVAYGVLAAIHRQLVRSGPASGVPSTRD